MYTPPKYLPEDWSQPIKGSIVDELITHYVNRTLIHEDRWDDLKAALKSAMLEIVPPPKEVREIGTINLTIEKDKGFNAAREEMIKNINLLFGEEV